MISTPKSNIQVSESARISLYGLISELVGSVNSLGDVGGSGLGGIREVAGEVAATDTREQHLFHSIEYFSLEVC